MDFSTSASLINAGVFFHVGNRNTACSHTTALNTRFGFVGQDNDLIQLVVIVVVGWSAYVSLPLGANDTCFTA